MSNQTYIIFSGKKEHQSSQVIKWVGIVFILLLIAGCDIMDRIKSDPLPSNPPTLPDLTQHQPQLDFFDSEIIEAALEDTTAYQMASYLVHSDFDSFVQGIYAYLPFLEGANQTEAESIDQGWEWKYSLTQQEQRYDINLTAMEGDGERDNYMWTLLISTPQNQEEPFNDYKLMELYTQRDRNSGSWIIYPPEYQDPNADFPTNLSLYWESYSLNNTEYYYEFYPYSSDSNEQIQAGYIIDDNNNFEYNRQINMYMENAEFEQQIFNIAWNKDTKVGFLYLQGNVGGEILDLNSCWNENLNDIECSF